MNEAQRKKFFDLANRYAGSTLDTKARAADLLAFVEGLENPITLDVSDVMKGFLRRSVSGGMPLKDAEEVQSCIDTAQELGYFNNPVEPRHVSCS